MQRKINNIRNDVGHDDLYGKLGRSFDMVEKNQQIKK